MSSRPITQLPTDSNAANLKRDDIVAVERGNKTFGAVVTGKLLLPDATTNDAGKFLQVSSTGAWVKGTYTLANGAVDTAQLAADAVDGTKIEDDAVGVEHLKLDADSSTAQGAFLQLTSTGMAFKLGAAISVSTANIQDDAVIGTKIADDAIGAEHLKTNAVESAAIKDGAVIHAKLGAAAVESDNIAAGAVGSAALATSSVRGGVRSGNNWTTREIAHYTITDNELARGSIDWGALAPSAVFARHVQGNGTPAAGKYLRLTSTNADSNDTFIGSGTKSAPTGPQLRFEWVSKPVPASNEVLSSMIANDAVINRHLGADCVTASELADDAVGAEHLNAGAGTAGQVLKRNAANTGLIWADDADSGAAGLDLAREVDADLAAEFWGDFSPTATSTLLETNKSSAASIIGLNRSAGTNVSQADNATPNEGDPVIRWIAGPSGTTAGLVCKEGQDWIFYGLRADGTAGLWKGTGSANNEPSTWTALPANEQEANVRGLLEKGNVLKGTQGDAFGRPSSSLFDGRPFLAKRVGDVVYLLAAKITGTAPSRTITVQCVSRTYSVPAAAGTLIYGGDAADGKIPVYRDSSDSWVLEDKPSGSGPTYEDIVRFSTPIQAADSSDRTLAATKSFADYDFIIIERKEQPGDTVITAHSPMFLRALAVGNNNEIISFPNWSSSVQTGINIDLKTNTTWRITFVGAALGQAGEGLSAIIGVKL